LQIAEMSKKLYVYKILKPAAVQSLICSLQVMKAACNYRRYKSATQQKFNHYCQSPANKKATCIKQVTLIDVENFEKLFWF